MKGPFEAVRVTDRVYWVGAIDWHIREFHGYATHRGTTYNAFLVVGDEVTLVDTVKPAFFDEMMSRVASVVDPAKVETIVSNHAEMDHSGSLPQAIAQTKPRRVLASKKGVEALGAHFGDLGAPLEAVPPDSTIDLGGVRARFIETRMLHWPDSMFTLLEDDGVLFSQDAFGMHLATTARFADEIPADVLEREAAKYYANILLPFSSHVTKLLARVTELGLAPKVIAPDHGPIFRNDVSWPIVRYGRWAEQAPTKKAVIVFDTMWESTAAMARAIEEGLRHGGADPVQVMALGSSHRSDVATEVLDAGALIVGSPTLNNQLFPSVADVLTYLAGLKPKNLVGAAFGSYGWSGESVARIEEFLDRMKVERVAESVKVVYVPGAGTLEKCRDLGMAVAKRLVG
jgi:flavorubredoxin